MPHSSPPSRRLSPLPVRLLVYLVLTAVALLAIRTIDRHVMSRDTGIHQTPEPTATD